MLKNENKAKIIFHIDMNAFFCSVACILYPYLRGTVFAIGRENSYKGVISTASYEARALGIHSAMPLVDAYKIKPDLMVVHVDYKIYEAYHHKFVNLIKQYTDIIEVASIDELYADMTELSKTKHPLVIAKEIQSRLLSEYNLPCSIGIAPTLYLAKMASDMKKPLGVTVIRKREVKEKLYPLSVADIFGIGKRTYPVLQEAGILTIEDFMNPDNKEKVLGIVGLNSYQYVTSHVMGNSSNIVDGDRYAESKSISTSSTYDIPLEYESEILLEMRKMAREIVNRMHKEKYYCRNVCITLRDTDFNTITRQKALDSYTDDFDVIMDVVADLLEENYIEKTYRLIGVGTAGLVPTNDLPKEYNLFTISETEERLEVINGLIRNFQEKYGNDALYINKNAKFKQKVGK